MKKFDRIISLLSCGALLFGQGAFAGKKEARGNVKELPVVESVKKKRKRSKGKNNLGGGKKLELPGDPLVGKSDKKRSRENKGKNNLGDGEKPKLPGDPLVKKGDKKRSRENKGKNNLGGGEKPKLSGNPSGDSLLNWVKRHPYESAGGAAVLSVASVLAARKIHDAISQPFKVAILGRKELREKFIESLKKDTSVVKEYIGEKIDDDDTKFKFVVSNLAKEKQVGMRSFISRIIELGTDGYNRLNKVIVGNEKVSDIEQAPRTVFNNIDYVIEDSIHGTAHRFYDFDLSYDNWRIGGFDLGALPFLSKIWFGTPHVCIILLGNDDQIDNNMFNKFGYGNRMVGFMKDVVKDDKLKEGDKLQVKLIANSTGEGFVELGFFPILVRVDSLEGESKAVPKSKSGGLVPEYLVYDPESGKAAIPDGALEIFTKEDNDVETEGGFVDKYAGKGKAYSEGGHGKIVDVG